MFEKAIFDVRGNGFEGVEERFSSLDISFRCQNHRRSVMCVACVAYLVVDRMRHVNSIKEIMEVRVVV